MKTDIYSSVEDAMEDREFRGIDYSYIPVRLINLVGIDFERLFVVRYAGIYPGNKSSMWVCKCSCSEDRYVIIRSDQLRRGVAKSCGCLVSESSSERFSKHLMSHSPEYICWRNMISRCTNQNNPQYEDYGDRGIYVCEEWAKSFEVFLSDMGSRSDDSHSLDRIDVNGNYCKENCRWTVRSVQNHNQRVMSNNTTGYRGVSKINSGKFVAEVSKDGVRVRKSGFTTAEEAADWYNIQAVILYGDEAKLNDLIKYGVEVDKFKRNDLLESIDNLPRSGSHSHWDVLSHSYTMDGEGTKDFKGHTHTSISWEQYSGNN